ncbi:DUF84 family protein [Bradyrhizobium liaoningense]|uniref:DUF84 family protein n=1 Tax=Bradyrhizobium liaoningense TaxID=43992 RepID=UPI001BAD6E3F|nr:DUF84 family protein [Bradyrhizobium liaoningense]MBR0844154.1 DUF84 family protein [Bradyrhizobium liaoningense]
MPVSSVIVAVASTNAAKLAATRRAFSDALQQDIELCSQQVQSAVSETPSTDEEAVVGCLNRLSGMGFPSGAKYSVALEGMLERRSFGSFLYGWAVIREASSRRVSIGCSGKVMVPEALLRGFRDGYRLSDWIAGRYPDANVETVVRLGSNGLISKGRYTRVHEFDTALRCALGFLLNEHNFADEYKGAGSRPDDAASVGGTDLTRSESEVVEEAPRDDGARGLIFGSLLQGRLL